MFLSQISPFTLGCDLSLKDIECLYIKIEEVLKKAIREGGTTLQDHKNISGEIGYFQNYLSVIIEKIINALIIVRLSLRRDIQNGRSTYYCPSCQNNFCILRLQVQERLTEQILECINDIPINNRIIENKDSCFLFESNTGRI